MQPIFFIIEIKISILKNLIIKRLQLYRSFFMYHLSTWIYLAETDATGVIFFPKLLEKCMAIFEMFLSEKKSSLKIFFDHKYFFPVVQAEARFTSPIYASDAIDITLEVEKIGSSSVSFVYKFYKEKTAVAEAKITHVLIDSKTRKKYPLPQKIIAILQELK